MWQVALGAALAAGSGFLAKRLINPNDPQPIQDSSQNHPKSDQPSEKDSIFGAKMESFGEESIFRFSSSERGLKNLRKKKYGCGSRRNKGDFEGPKRKVDQRSIGSSGKKFYVCLKKRRTSKTGPGKCDSCSSKGNSIFGWGVGIGMMCMMSARRAEISKLNEAVDETSKAVQELKYELSRGKTSHDIREEHLETSFDKLQTENRNDKRIYTEEGEYASSVLTDELQPAEAREMDHLEAELESELQKLHGFGVEADMFETEELYRADEDLKSYVPNGVIPSELNQKLCQVLIEQQENQIEELESELQRSHRKLHEKEAELQALKDCVRRLTEFSLDEETERCVEQHSRIVLDDEMKQNLSAEFRKSLVGNKRTSMEF